MRTLTRCQILAEMMVALASNRGVGERDEGEARGGGGGGVLDLSSAISISLSF